MANKLIKPSGGYTIVSNSIMKEKNKSLKVIGLYSFLLSLPENWEFSVAGLASILNDGKDAIRAAVNHLETLGYLRRVQSKDEKGCFNGYDWQIFYEPVPLEDYPLSENPTTDNQSTIFPMTETPSTEKSTQLNINKENKNLKDDGNRNKELSARAREARKNMGLVPEPEIIIVNSPGELQHYLEPFFEWIHQRIHLMSKNEELQKTLLIYDIFKAVILGGNSSRKLSAAAKLECDDVCKIFKYFKNGFGEIIDFKAYIWETIFRMEQELDTIDETSPGVTRREKRALLRGRNRKEDREMVIAMNKASSASEKEEGLYEYYIND